MCFTHFRRRDDDDDDDDDSNNSNDDWIVSDTSSQRYADNEDVTWLYIKQKCPSHL